MKTGILYRQNRAFKNAMVFDCKLKASSQTRRRGFGNHSERRRRALIGANSAAGCCRRLGQ